MYYAVQKIGYGKLQKFIIVQVIKGKGTNPTGCRPFKTEQAAREAAADMGYKIEASGDYWEII